MRRRRPSGARALRLVLLLIGGLALRASAQSAVRFEPSSLAFGELEVGVGSAPLSATVHNTGGSGTRISFLASSPELGVDDSDCGGRLAAGARCVVWVSLTPRTAGAFSGTVSAVLDGGTAALQVVGHGVVSEYPVTAGVLRGSGHIGPQRQIVVHKKDAVFTVTPDPGWRVAAVTGDTCAPARNGDGTWIAEAIVAPCAVQAGFTIEDRGTEPGESFSQIVLRARPAPFTPRSGPAPTPERPDACRQRTPTRLLHVSTGIAGSQSRVLDWRLALP